MRYRERHIYTGTEMQLDEIWGDMDQQKRHFFWRRLEGRKRNTWRYMISPQTRGCIEENIRNTPQERNLGWFMPMWKMRKWRCILRTRWGDSRRQAAGMNEVKQNCFLGPERKKLSIFSSQNKIEWIYDYPILILWDLLINLYFNIYNPLKSCVNGELGSVSFCFTFISIWISPLNKIFFVYSLIFHVNFVINWSSMYV